MEYFAKEARKRFLKRLIIKYLTFMNFGSMVFKGSNHFLNTLRNYLIINDICV